MYTFLIFTVLWYHPTKYIYTPSIHSSSVGLILLPFIWCTYTTPQAARAAVEAGVRSGGGAALPGMVFNTGKNVSFHDAATGDTVSRRAGRLECTMQNLADCFAQRFGQQLPKQLHGDLDTFVVFNTRRKVTSSAKRRREPGSLRIAQTPDGSFLDLQANAAELLTLCDVEVPEACDVESYLANGPPFIFLHHPALGPVWSLIAQKVQGGRLEAGSELVLEVADAQVSNLQLQGSLIVRCVLVDDDYEEEHCVRARSFCRVHKKKNDIRVLYV